MKLAVDFILVAGIFSTLLIIFLLTKTQQRNLSHKILILLLSLLLCVIIAFYGVLHDIKSIFYATFLIYFSIGYLAGPLFYLYVQSLFLPKENLIKKNQKHFIPFLINSIFWHIPVFISNLKGAFIFSYLKTLAKNGFDEIEFAIQVLFFLLYGFLSFRLLKKYQKQVKHNYSNLSDRMLTWIEYLILGTLLAMITSGILTILQIRYGEHSWNADYLIAFPLVGTILYLGYYGLTQPQILLPSFLVQPTVEATIPSTKQSTPTKHHLSNVSESEITQLKQSLLSLLEKERPYLNEELTLTTLANLVPTTDKKLSALLNHYLDTTFYDFVNGYRVEEVKTKIKDPKFSHYTLLAIGLESGFKSKASFNRIFKKVTGLSPSKYKAQLLNEIS